MPAGPFDFALVEGLEAFIRGDIETSRHQLHRALRMKPWDDPDLIDAHRRLGDVYYQFGGNSKESLEHAEKHYVQFLRLAKAMMDSPTYAVGLRYSHPHARTPERSLYDEYVLKLSGVYMDQGLSPEKAEKKATRLGRSGCFIATAAYGTDLAPEVMTLRRFRDQYLAESAAGRAVIRFYEFASPKIAEKIFQRKTLCALIRLTLIRPMASLARTIAR